MKRRPRVVVGTQKEPPEFVAARRRTRAARQEVLSALIGVAKDLSSTARLNLEISATIREAIDDPSRSVQLLRAAADRLETKGIELEETATMAREAVRMEGETYERMG